MRLMFVITRGDSIGGAQIHVRDLARRLAGDGHTVRVAMGATGPLTEALAEAGIDSVTVPGLLREIHLWHDARAVTAMHEAIVAFRPDLVTTHSSKAGIIGRLAAWRAKTPCLFTAHGWAFTGGVPQPRRTMYRALECLCAPLAVRIVCVSEHDRQLAIRSWIPARRLVTVHNGMPDIPPELHASPARPGPVRLVMVARFDQQKDHRSLFAAVKQIDGVILDLVGDGPDLERTKALARELQIAGRVNFLGRRTDAARVLGQAHVFVLSSNWEGFPMTTLEAMRAGLPTVVSNVGGAAEAVIEGETGHVVERGDVATLTGRLRALVDSPATRGRMGGAARRRYEDAFTFDHMYRKTLAVYDEATARRKA